MPHGASRYGTRAEPKDMAAWLQTMTYEQIAHMLGKTRSWVCNYVHRHALGGASPPGAVKVRSPHQRRPEKTELEALVHLTKHDIASRYKVAIKTVENWQAHYGLRFQVVRKAKTRPDYAEWREVCAAMTIEEVKRHYSVSSSTVWQWASIYGMGPIRTRAAPARSNGTIPEGETISLAMDWARKALSTAEGINGYRYSMGGVCE